MDIRKVRTDRFNAAFQAMLRNADFDMGNACRCLKGSYSKFVLGIRPVTDSFSKAVGNQTTDEHFGISRQCYYEWYFPLGTGRWDTDKIDLTDAVACIDNVKRIVEKHHGPQQWDEPSADERPTLAEFLKTLDVKTSLVAAE